MKAESNNGYLKASVIVEQNEITGGSGQETSTTNHLQVRDFRYSGVASSNLVKMIYYSSFRQLIRWVNILWL